MECHTNSAGRHVSPQQKFCAVKKKDIETWLKLSQIAGWDCNNKHIHSAAVEVVST